MEDTMEQWKKLCRHSPTPESVWEQLANLRYYAEAERKESIAKWKQHFKQNCTPDGWEVVRKASKDAFIVEGLGTSCSADKQWYTKEDACLFFDHFARKINVVGYYGA